MTRFPRTRYTSQWVRLAISNSGGRWKHQAPRGPAPGIVRAFQPLGRLLLPAGARAPASYAQETGNGHRVREGSGLASGFGAPFAEHCPRFILRDKLTALFFLQAVLDALPKKRLKFGGFPRFFGSGRVAQIKQAGSCDVDLILLKIIDQLDELLPCNVRFASVVSSLGMVNLVCEHPQG